MAGELVNRETGELVDITAPRSVAEVVARANMIREIADKVMQGPTKEHPGGIHYGLIPGCGSKPTLLKPGAEILTTTFRLRPIIKESGEDVKIIFLENGHRDYTVFCHIFNMADMEVATGVGSCSTMESKYRYRGGEKKAVEEEDGSARPVPKEYWNLKKAGKLDEAQTLIGGPGFSAGKIGGAWVVCEVGEKTENPDIADVYNTVLKIAKKRAYIDGILSATGASERFTQDIEEFPDYMKRGAGQKTEAAPETEAAKDHNTADVPKEYKEMVSGFPGLCPCCKGKIEKGSPIIYRTSTKKAYHPDCFYIAPENQDLATGGQAAGIGADGKPIEM